ncbi:hypothetical protein BTVI_114660 [Pitangus sulphuratus]|nr:hypothetical protein BTVI_114660 [Pitangus sulphuratus]
MEVTADSSRFSYLLDLLKRDRVRASGKWCVSWDSVLGPVLFSSFISGTDSETKHNLSKFADDVKQSGAVDTKEGRDAFHGDMDKLDKWAQENLINFNKSKCKLGEEVTESSPMEKDLEVLVDEKLDMSQHFVH